METKIDVRMTGSEYMRHVRAKELKYRKFYDSLRKSFIRNKSVIVPAFAVMGTCVIILGITSALYPHNNPSIFDSWALMSWDALLKIGFCVMILSWLIHGVSVRLLA